jgi:hypothetical protein
MTTDGTKGSDTPGQQGVPGQPTDAQLAEMSRELVELGGRMDGVETVLWPRWPVKAPRPRSGPNAVSYWLVFGGISGLALLVVFCSGRGSTAFGSEGEFIYSLATPLYGVTFGLSIWRSASVRCCSRRSSSRGDLDPGPPRRRLPEIQRKTVRPTSPTRSRARPSSGAS